MGMHRAVIRQDDHMLAIVANGILTLGIDHDRAIMAHLLLQHRMAVIPVGARLDDWEFVDEGGPRTDTEEADPRNAIEKIGREHVSTPVTNAHIVCRIRIEKKKPQQDKY